MKCVSRLLVLMAMCTFAVSGFAQQIMEPDQLSATALQGSKGKTIEMAPHAHTNGMAHARHGIPGIDSLVNWNDKYFTEGVDQNNLSVNRWFTNTIGNPPNHHGTTVINAPIVPVIMDLRNADGTPRFVNGKRLISSAEPFVQKVLESPVFTNYNYSSSSTPTQFTDAVQRAEYFAKAKSDWHTVLAPSVKAARTMILKKGTYQFALNADGTCCFYILVDSNTFTNAFFPATTTDTTTPIGAAENAGDITTKDLSSFIFPNVFLIQGNFLVLGFHNYDYEPGDDSNGNIEKRYVVDYASWTNPEIFGPSFTDVTALSHEIAESYNDPFVASDGIHNVTPWWLSPNGNCQNNLEDGDVVEGLPNATFPITMPNGFTYHPQNEALLQFFTRQVPSSAIDGAFSYPNESVLTGPSAPQRAFCQ